MKRKIWLLLAVTALCALLLCACGECEHDWQAASCNTPKTCSLCGITEGEKLSHTYSDATCDKAKTCEVCGATDGAPLGHVWQVATCENAQTCTVCGAAVGEALGHSYVEATCEAPKTCTVCNKTEGEALGHAFADYVDCENPPKCGNCGIYSTEPTAHTWVDATCDTARTCAVCGATDGEALGHSWVDATCETAKTCAVCGAVEGEALGHSWVDATTEAPKTCEVCGKTEGERINTDSRFKTEACKAFFGDWITNDYSSYTAQSGQVVTVSYTAYSTFTSDGHWLLKEVFDLEEYKVYYELYFADYLYAYYGEMGYTADELNAAMLNQYGMNVEDYAAYQASLLTQEDVTTEKEYVYYVSGNTLYLAGDWSESFGENIFTMDGGNIYIQKQSGGQLVLTRDIISEG